MMVCVNILLVLVGIAGLEYGIAAFVKRASTTDVLFIKASQAEWPTETREPPSQEMASLSDHDPGDGPSKRLTFKAFGRDWTLDLQKNTMLFGKDLTFQIRDASRDMMMQDLGSPGDCFYIGTVDAGKNEAGLAAVSTCGGEIRGYLITNICDYLINPRISRGRRRSVEDHIYQIIERHLETKNKSTPGDSVHKMLKRDFGAEEIRHQPLLRPNGRVLFYEIGVVIDLEFTDELYRNFGLYDQDIPRYVAELLNYVQLWYLHSTLGYQIWVTMQKVIILQANIPVSPAEPSKLAAACNWHYETYKDAADWDGVFLLLGNKNGILGGIGGLAYPGTACQKSGLHCAGKAFDPRTAIMARGVAHEGSHVLGVSDDYVKPYVDICYTGMMREGLYEDRDWSTCSVQLLEHYLELKQEAKCLQSDATPSVLNLSPPQIPSNVAWRAEAEQSSTYYSEVAWGAWKAVDGSITGVPYLDPRHELGSCTRTQPEKDPWLMITLPDEYERNTIASIHIYNREDCCGDRLHDIEVRIGKNQDFVQNELCDTYKGAVPGGRYGMAVIKCKRPLSGKYISIQIKGDKEILTVCELMVYQDIQLPKFKVPEFKCVDRIYGCNFRVRGGECDTGYAVENCQFSCRYCSREIEQPTVSTSIINQINPGDDPTCKDQSRGCPELLAGGHCYTKDNIERCPRSCLNCKKPTTTTSEPTETTTTTTTTTQAPPCVDLMPDCGQWAAHGHCSLNPQLLHVHCRKSCGLC